MIVLTRTEKLLFDFADSRNRLGQSGNHILFTFSFYTVCQKVNKKKYIKDYSTNQITTAFKSWTSNHTERGRSIHVSERDREQRQKTGWTWEISSVKVDWGSHPKHNEVIFGKVASKELVSYIMTSDEIKCEWSCVKHWGWWQKLIRLNNIDSLDNAAGQINSLFTKKNKTTKMSHSTWKIFF